MENKFIIFFTISIFTIYIFSETLSRYSEFKSEKSDIDNRYYTVRNNVYSKKSANILAKINEKIQKLIKYTNDPKNGLNEIDNINFDPEMYRLEKRYSPNSLSETSNEIEYTSYTVNKGEKVSICLKCRDCSKETFEPENLLMFVVIHELAHIANNEEGHGEKFQRIFKLLLKKSIECDVWEYKDYSANPMKYCGLTVNSTPI